MSELIQLQDIFANGDFLVAGLIKYEIKPRIHLKFITGLVLMSLLLRGVTVGEADFPRWSAIYEKVYR